nr:hypothetical protein [Nocardioides humi]
MFPSVGESPESRPVPADLLGSDACTVGLLCQGIAQLSPVGHQSLAAALSDPDPAHSRVIGVGRAFHQLSVCQGCDCFRHRRLRDTVADRQLVDGRRANLVED